MKIGLYIAYWGGVGGGQRFLSVVAEVLSRQHSVEIIHHCHGFDPANVEEPMQVDLSRVHFRYIPNITRPNWATNNPLRRLKLEREVGKEVSAPYDLYVDTSDIPPLFNHARRGALLVNFPLVTFEEYHGHNTANWRARSLPKRWLTALYQKHEWRKRFSSYHLFMANSEFTKHWTKQLWGQDASIVYPPLRDGLAPMQKQKVVLSIGAFRAAQHKKQNVTIEAFKALCFRGAKDWRYVMVGACGPTDDDKHYLENLRKSAIGFPIDIFPDVTGSELKKWLESSAILWHSMGYGVDVQREPKRMEHFGMVATEAMAAGCVPIVFNGGGLCEIVTNGKTGFLWSTPEELIRTTLQVMEDDELRGRMSLSATEDSEIFAGPAFENRLLSTLRPVLS